jgi:Zn-dependent M28 family amino/carboxypeptidase
MISQERLKLMCAAFGRASFVSVVVLVSLVLMSCRRENSAASAAPTSPGWTAPASASELDPAPGAAPAPKVDGKRAFENVKKFLDASGKRFLGSDGHKKAEQFITSEMNATGAETIRDEFVADTVIGKFPVVNLISKIPGKKDGIIVIAGHYDTNYPLRDINFVGANDGGSNVGLMIELARVLKQGIKSPDGKLDGYSVWFVFTDAEEAMAQWSAEDSVYGSKHLAQQWQHDGTAAKVRAFILLDMIGDKDLDVQRETQSTPWLQDTVLRAAQRLGLESHFYAQSLPIEDDHLPFKNVGIPVVDLIDLNYGLGNAFHHTSEDTLDKLSPDSLQVVGDVTLETIRALNTK